MTSVGVRLDKFSVGVGDRFAHQAKAQLEACVRASRAGVEVVPVWNKSNREHNLIGSEPSSTRAAADAAVKALHWTKPYYCDADHINFQTVGRFLASSDFYTIDVSDFIGRKPDQSSIDTFVRRHSELVGEIKTGADDRDTPDAAGAEHPSGFDRLERLLNGEVGQYRRVGRESPVVKAQ